MLKVKSVSAKVEPTVSGVHRDRGAQPANDKVDGVLARSLQTALPAGDATRVRYLRQRWQAARQ